MTIKSQIKRNIALHPICFLIVLILLVLSLGGLVIPLWYKRARRIENEVKLIDRNIDQELASSIQKATALFSPINASATNLVRVLNSSLGGDNNLPFSVIESKVAMTLFQALSTIPYLSQISYIGLDGLFFAYYTESGRSYALYSNSTFQNSTKSYTWYVQTADCDTGKLYGEAIESPPSAVVNSSWFQAALNSANGCVTVGHGWGNYSNILLLSTARMGGRSVLSLGFSMESIVGFLVAEVTFYNGILYLATKDGYVLNEGIPNMRVMSANDMISLLSLGGQINATINFTCHSNNGTFTGSTVLSIWGSNYTMHCSPIEIAGLQLVYVLALPSNYFLSIIDQNITWALVILILMIGAVVVMTCAFVYLAVEFARREMYLCGALISQMEATQQAERKSMNKSLAFASASHDIRASLAGIIGLIDLCHNFNQVSIRDPSRKELQTNLLQIETCTMDLLGILNSILDTSKIEAGKMQLDEEEFDIEQLLENMVDLYHPVGMKKGVDIILDSYDGSVTKCSRVKGDQGKLKQILSNLLSNAVKFTSEGDVTVRAWTRKSSLENEILASNVNSSWNCLFCFNIERSYGDLETVNNIRRDSNGVEFVFEVNDTGKGIPKEKQKYIFENYVQVKEVAAGQEGTGLGLGIVQSLVRLMGGEIRIMDKDVGERGTCFRFNVFMSACDATDISASVISTRAADIESNVNFGSSDSYQHSGPSVRVLSPKAGISQVLLFIHSPKRRKVMQDFMQRLGIKVHVVWQHQLLSLALKQINQKLNLSHLNSSSNSRSDGLTSRVSSMQKDGDLVYFILLVIDTRAGPFQETCRAIAEFRNGLNENCSIRVVWLYDPTISSGSSHVIDKDMLSPSDLIISKPFHGSRLYQTLGLLPEFGGTLPTREEKINTENVPSRRMTPNGTSASSKRGEKGKSFRESFGTMKSEIEEVGGPDSRKPLKGKRILLVDDDPVGRRIAMTVCSQLGANIVSCTNGAEANDRFCTRLNDIINNVGNSQDLVPFDCILMDCQMPVMNGIEATMEIRKVEGKYRFHTPIMALTAHQQGEEIDKMIEAGVDGYLTKPLNRDDLLRIMSNFDIKSRSRRIQSRRQKVSVIE